ncbi:molybdopterin-containing oxidoreductase family protein [Curtanaerobium respiraculi]|uniref:molybdopterin-containing oxidoreductase family protein n=1 Tax=Curtanaerobium respiraculi TaxID=2949669 RepID=UPI0024B3AE50|nr:molybdopterin-dependent oxidoreductase [Curtanaerobium respiraculi]
MTDHTVTRRGFLAGTAGMLGGVLAAGSVESEAWAQESGDGEAGQTRAVHSACNGCSNKCGFTAYVENGKLKRMVGDADHAKAKGKLCARGYALAEWATSPDRLQDPLKRKDDGTFEAISWDQAYEEIGESVKKILAESGPGALAMVQDPRPSGDWYTRRFMEALGSKNVYTHAAACNISRESAYTLVVGTKSWSVDFGKTNMVMFIGRSYADGVRPAALANMVKAHERGARIVCVDPRFTNSQQLADEWVPIKPGTDLAFVLALSNHVIENNLYDADFIAEHAYGFEEYAEAIKQYTPEWAADITGVPSDTIKRLATQMAEAAPACGIEPGWRGPSGNSYVNSGELARAVVLFNGLMGAWNADGGVTLTPGAVKYKLDEAKFPTPPKPTAKQVGSKEFPLAMTKAGTALAAAKAAMDGEVRGMFFYNSNMVGGYSNPAYLAECVKACELSVCIDIQMSETAKACKYVLPDTSFLERAEIPQFDGGKTPTVFIRCQVLDKTYPNTKPVDEIFVGLAKACGIGQYFDFTVEEVSRAMLDSAGIDYDELCSKGTMKFKDAAFVSGTKPKWKTASGKMQFVSEEIAAAGYQRTPSWIPPAVTPGEDEFRLIAAKQPIHSHTMTSNVKGLMNITKRYDLTAAWINTADAEKRKISDGDTIEISNEKYTGKTHAHVTDRIVEGVIYLPDCYGRHVEEQHIGNDVGLNPPDFLDFQLEPGYGGSMRNEIAVKVKKVGA